MCCWLVSRRSVLFVVVAVALLASPLPPELLLVLGHVGLAFVAAVAVAYLFAPFLPAIKVSGRDRLAVLVTGCSSGFGLETALALDKMGVPVIATCRNPSAQAVLDLQKNASNKLRVVKMDVVSDESVATAAQEVRGILGENKLWAVVNNAGVMPLGEGLWMDDDEARHAYEVNAASHARVIRHFMPQLKESRGRIVNIISIACSIDIGGSAPYTMSKYAGLGLARSMRAELDRFGVSVHTIEPAGYKTRMIGNKSNAIKEAWDKSPQWVKDMYDPEYGKRFESTAERMSFLFYPASKISDVTGCVKDACFARDPRDRYTPDFLGRIAVVAAAFFPWGIDLINKAALPKIVKNRPQNGAV